MSLVDPHRLDRHPSLVVPDDSIEFLRLTAHRLTARLNKCVGWVKDKGRQVRSMPADDSLVRAVLSAEKSPVEGARCKVGERLNIYTADGGCIRMKICGVRSGGFSNVYTAIDLDEMKAYCLKENRALPGDEHERNSKLAAEAEISLRLGLHPHLVTTYSAFTIKSRLFILTEYVPGTSLDLHLKSARLGLQTTLKYAVHLCRAINHSREILPGFVHGDIKPGNCLITADGTLKLADFGLASAAGIGRHSTPDASGDRVAVAPDTNPGWGGTASYMAPEMFDRENPKRDAADVYAFGITLFEMLCGVRPFAGASKNSLINLHRSAEPSFQMLEGIGLPKELIELVGRCLAKSPVDRPQDFHSVEKELQEISVAVFNEPVPDESILESTESHASVQALGFAELNKFDEAARLLDQAGSAKPNSPSLLARKAIALALGGRIDDAYAASTAALMMRADVFIVLFAHARVLLSRGDLELAENYLHRALVLRPDNCMTLNLLGALYTKLEQYRDAKIFFGRSIAIDGTQAETLEGIAKLEYLKGQYKRALKFTRKALLLDPDRAASHEIIADVHFAQDHFVDAVRSYKDAFANGCESRTARRRYTRSCGRLIGSATGKYLGLPGVRTLINGLNLMTPGRGTTISPDRFTEDFAAVFSRSDLDPMWLFFQDAVFVKLSCRLSDESIEKLLDGLRTASKRFEAQDMPAHLHHSLGRIFYELRAYDDCEFVFRKMLEQCGPNESSYYYFGVCAEIAEDFDTALKHYKKALKLKNCEDNRTGIRRATNKLKRSKSKTTTASVHA